MAISPELLPVVQITLPLLAGMFLAGWMQNKRVDDLRADIKEFRNEVHADLEGIRRELHSHGERITRIEERFPPLVRR